MDLSTSIFSYNRGAYLENCVDSVRRCFVEMPFRVFDDGSTDKVTQVYLQSLGENVVHCRAGQDSHLGGLYNNMQRALDRASSKYILFLQDDTQVVRRIDQQDVDCIEAFFDKNPDAAFLNPVFLRGHRRKSIDSQIRPAPEFQGYFQEISEQFKPRSVAMYYCDVVIAHVERLRAVNWQFAVDCETSNAEIARIHFSKMLQMAHPFVMHLPEVPIYRGNKTTLGAKLSAKRVGDDVKAFKIMEPAAIKEMRERDINKFPYADDFLATENLKVTKPFCYNAVSKYWDTRVMHKIELNLRKICS